MFKSYFITAIRSFRRNKLFSFINILGLAIGISASLVIFLLVQYEFGFDKFEKDGNRIYRVISKFVFSGETYRNSGVTSPLTRTIGKELTGIELVVPIRLWNREGKISIPFPNNNEPKIFKKQENIALVDENYFKLLPYNWIFGSPKSSLSQPYQVVLTEKMAGVYYPGLPLSQVMGKEIIFNDTTRANISGIVQELNQNTDFSFTTFMSLVTLDKTSMKPYDWDQWGSTTSAMQVIVKLSPGVSTAGMEKLIVGLYNKYKKKEADDNSKTSYALQPLNDLHFNPDYGNFNGKQAHKPTLYGLLAVAAFLLLLACINFINLTTAQASQRAREIGIRKTMGSSKGQLVIQFLSETFLLTLVAAILSVLMAPLLLKVFADFIPDGLHFNIFKQPMLILFLLGITVIVTMLAGFYPALILSGFKPILVLKNQAFSNSGKTRNVFLRKTLTVSQFVIAQIFIIATILVSKQIHYTLSKDLGFKKDAILYFSTNYYDTVASHRSVFMEKMKAIPEIAMVSLSNGPPNSNNTWTNTMKYKDGKKEIETDVQVKLGDTNYVKMFKLKMLAGQILQQGDSVTSLLINEKYAHVLGFTNPADAVGKNIVWNDKQNVPIKGVLADFHQHSLHDPIKPLVLGNAYKEELTFNIALQPQNEQGMVWKNAIAKMEKAWKEVYPNDDFEYEFLDETIAKFYTTEKNISKLLMWATGLTIFISCLGLLGLVIYITNQRTKEIGIRKVIGASIVQIISLLSKDFLQLVAIAFLIAVPIAWWAASKWLNNFAYKTSLSWWVFLMGGCIMFILAFFILGIRTFKAASANPVKSLRTE